MLLYTVGVQVGADGWVCSWVLFPRGTSKETVRPPELYSKEGRAKYGGGASGWFVNVNQTLDDTVPRIEFIQEPGDTVSTLLPCCP